MNRRNNINCELLLYFICWICSVSYAIYSLAVTADEYFQSNDFEDTYNDFTKGWTFLHRLKDTSDTEWKYVKTVLKDLMPWFITHLIIAEILRQSYQQCLIYWYTIISFLFITTNFGVTTLIFFSIQPVLGHAALQFKSKTAIWIYFSLCLIIINSMKSLYAEIFGQNNYLEYVNITGIFWVNLRSLNYFLEAVNDSNIQKICFKNIFTSLSYCLYLPFLFTGPLVLFVDFKTVFNSKLKSVSLRLKDLAKNLLRFIFWAYFIEFALHFVYVNALIFQPQIMKNLNSWALYGAGYCMGQYFQMKYVVFYGISTSIGNFEGIPLLKTPICIGRVHLYSDMWKYFDRGLYLFLLKYIYMPLYNKDKKILRKFLASFLCFLFVYVWHGIYDFIAIWSILNFIGVTVETIVYEISQISSIKSKIITNMSDNMYRRLKCVLATPIFAMSAISNFYFFAGKEIGDIYVYRFLTDPFYVTMNILIILYFGSQVSTEIKLMDKAKECKKVP